MSTATPTNTPATGPALSHAHEAERKTAAHLATLRTQLADAHRTVAEAEAAIVTRRAEAIAAALHVRDLAYCTGDIVRAEDDDYRTARSEANRTASALALARRALVHAEFAMEQLTEQCRRADQAAALAARRASVLQAQPALGTRLDAAQQAVQDVKALTGPNAAHEQQQAAFWLQKAEQAIADAVAAPR